MARIEGEEALQKFDVELANDTMSSAATLSGGKLTNEQVAHEILLDGMFQLSDDGYEYGGGDAVAWRRTRESFWKGFWDALETDLSMLTPCYVRLLRVLTEIKDGIVALSSTSGIEEVIDEDMIRERVAVGAYSYQDAMNLVMVTSGILLGMQTKQTRKAQTREMLAVVQAEAADKKGVVKGLAFLMDRVNVMRVDEANVRLRRVAPTIQQHGTEYETLMFREKVCDKRIVPALTMNWLASSMGGSTRTSLSSGASRIDLHTRALLSMLNAKEKFVETTIAETLKMDIHHMNTFRHEFQFLIKAKTLLVLLGMERLPGTPPSSNHMESRREAMERVATARTILEAADEFEVFDIGKFVIPPMIANMVHDVELGEREGPVRTLMRVQLEKELQKRIAGGARQQTFFKDTGALFSRTEILLQHFCKLASINRAVHSQFYGNIIDHVLEHGSLDGVVAQTFGV